MFISEAGSSAHINRSAASRFSSLVRYAMVIEDSLDFHRINTEFNQKTFNENTWIILLSRTGETQGSLTKATNLQRLGCKVLAITASEDTTLGRISDVCLPTYFRPSDNNTSYVPILFLVEELSIVASKMIR
ncbi:SIS domain-containing protein [Erysipelothrix urinaevulpis]|uniref:SIS domain-containing protein n=1 Tax=Erysipelothrix urinaevulpis TaxID=2683717 RepID=UPI0013582B5C|nr:SIS domain-containing protein [Erysipelothrix urinaevulpis]